MPNQRFLSTAKFFCKHSYRDMKRRKCHFFLAFCSVFIVVVSTLVINTVISKGPVIFLKMAEGEEGEADAYITPRGEYLGEKDSETATFMNYTRIYDLY